LTLRGHTDTLFQVDWSPDGRRVASASANRIVKIWDLTKPQDYVALRGHSGAVISVAWSPNGRWLASGSADRSIKIWDPATREQPRTLNGHKQSIYSLAWSPDGRELAVGAGVGPIRVLDSTTGREAYVLSGLLKRGSGIINAVTALAWSPTGKQLAAVSPDQTVKIWDTITRQEVVTLTGHGDILLRLAWSPNGKRLAAAGDRGTIQVWDTVNWQELLPLAGHPGEVNCLAWSTDNQRLASGGRDGTIRMWQLATQQEILCLRGHTGSVTSIAWHPDQQRLVSASQDGTIKLWDLARAHEIFGWREAASAVGWSPDGKRLAIASKDRTVQVWDASPGYLAREPVRPSSNPLRRQETARTYQNLSSLLQGLHHREEAERALGDALAIQKKLVAEFPTVASYRVDLASTHFLRGKLKEQASGHQAKGDLDGAIAAYNEAIALNPKFAEAHNNLAWLLATCQESRFRDADQAVRLATKAVELAPNVGNFWNTLGVANYRAGKWKAAIGALEKSMALRKGGDSEDWFFLAMAHWQLNKKEKARAWYDKAVEWMDKHPPKNEELRRFRAEAAKLLGLKDGARK
jgi:WD40 repeat protein